MLHVQLTVRSNYFLFPVFQIYSGKLDCSVSDLFLWPTKASNKIYYFCSMCFNVSTVKVSEETIYSRLNKIQFPWQRFTMSDNLDCCKVTRWYSWLEKPIFTWTGQDRQSNENWLLNSEGAEIVTNQKLHTGAFSIRLCMSLLSSFGVTSSFNYFAH